MTELTVVSDYGLDDAVALAALLEWNGFDRLNVVAAAGNATAEASLENAKKLLRRTDPKIRKKVTLVDTVNQAQHYARLPSIHGEDGMGDLFGTDGEDIPAISFAEFSSGFRGGDILSLGPCTLPLLLAEKAPERIGKLLIMGGLVKAEPNYNGYEFNHGLDADAFSALTEYPHEIATLDTCRVPVFNLAHMRTGGGSLKNILIDRAEELAEARHNDNCYIYDYITALRLIEPSLFTAVKKTDPWGNELNMLVAK